MLQKENVDVSGIVIDEKFQTPVKKRMMAECQQLLRVDYENPLPLSFDLEVEIKKQLSLVLDQVDVIAISDYAKGFLTESLLQYTIELAKEKNIPVIVDPKGSNFSKYRGATLIKPNLSEAITASGLDKKTSLDLIGTKILKDIEIDTLMITRSKEGISLFNLQKGRDDFPAFVHEVKDVTGAGDTVLAIVTQTLANRLDLKIGAFLANIAAGIAIERVGCARITLHELEARLLQISKKDDL
jgi:rfaE bifunctional protein kinase chain/domain